MPINLNELGIVIVCNFCVCCIIETETEKSFALKLCQSQLLFTFTQNWLYHLKSSLIIATNHASNVRRVLFEGRLWNARRNSVNSVAWNSTAR